MVAQSCSPTQSPRAQVETLLSIISASTQAAMAEYEKAGFSIPTPDMPQEHPSDSCHLANLIKSITILEGSCRKLIQTLAPPVHTMRDYIMTPAEYPCLRIAVEMRVSDILAESDGIHINEIAKKTHKPIEPQKLCRVIRFLVSRGYFREVSHNVFANNRLSFSLQSSNPIASLLLVSARVFSKGLGSLPDALTDPDFGFSEETDKAPFMYAVRNDSTRGGFFDWLQQHPADKEHFAIGMVGLNNVSTPGLHCPVWSELPKDTSICDVGSGVGGFSIRLARAYPTFKVTLIDRPDVMDQAKKFWTSEYPQAIQAQRVNFVSGDFLQEVPGNCDIYFARHIIHNWADSKAMTILRNIKRAMRPDSRLFIEDYVLPHSDNVKDKSTPDLTEEAFLTDSKRLYHLDMMMLTLLNAKERALYEFNDLCSQVGFRFINRWSLRETSLLEYEINDIRN